MSTLATSAAPADITAARLQLFAPRSDYLALAPHLDSAAKANGILTPRQVRHWLAQVHHESAGFTRLEEDLHYTAAGLLKTWPSHFTAASAAKCAGDPQAIACIAYAGRDGNRDPQDGCTFRGRGFLQLTGRAAYRSAGQRLLQPYESQPWLVGELSGGAATAADFWRSHALNHVLAAQPDDTRAATAIRRVINGALAGLDDVLQQLRRAATIWRN